MPVDFGFFAVIEGPDGSGKSTLCAAVGHVLATLGHTVRLTREPYDRERVDRLTGQGLTGEAAYTLDRAAHWREVVWPALCSGEVVLSDRYYLSTAVHQGDAGGDGGGFLHVLDDQLRRFAGPGLVVVLAADADVCLARLDARSDEPTPPPEVVEAWRARYLSAAAWLMPAGVDVIAVACDDSLTTEAAAQRVAYEILRRW